MDHAPTGLLLAICGTIARRDSKKPTERYPLWYAAIAVNVLELCAEDLRGIQGPACGAVRLDVPYR